jgi:hypothetical protein
MASTTTTPKNNRKLTNNGIHNNDRRPRPPGGKQPGLPNNKQKAQHNKCNQKGHKPSIIRLSHTIANPRTMMVKFLYAYVALVAV